MTARPTLRGMCGAFAALTLVLGVAVAAPAGASTPATTVTTEAAGAPGGSIGLRLVDAPTTARDDPRARVYIVDHLNPGAVIERRIEVSNTTAETASIALYPAAASIDSGSFLGDEGRTANDLSTWTSVTPADPDIPAGGKQMATVKIAVPLDAPPGEQYGVVWAEARSAPTEGGGVTQVSRVGIRLYVSVGPGGAPAADFTIDSVIAERSADGLPVVRATVHNTGGRALDMNGTLELRDGPGGLSAGPFPASLGTTLAIGATELVTITLDDRLPAGPWDAEITLSSGLVERSAGATITFPDSEGAAAPVEATPSLDDGMPYPALAGVGVALLGGAGLLVWLTRHMRPPTRRRGKHRRPRGTARG